MLIQADDPLLYQRIHRLVRKLRGPASAHFCARCEDRPALHWAQIRTESGLDPWADYLPLCMSCHQVYDQVNVGHKHTDTTREKISNAAKGRKLSPAHKAALVNSRKGVPMSQEHKDKIAAGRTSKKHSDETKERLRQFTGTRERDVRGRLL